MKVLQWGDSLAVRLPAAIVEKFKLKEGDEIEIQITHRHVAESTPEQRQRALENLRKLRVSLPPGFVFDREDAHRR
ncbi:MAG: AbrB/MazE/SpoVT family DNA-binding domain-containing protein [Candidatus Sulfotelmatobacter sp.]|jgi:antitoxin MazE